MYKPVLTEIKALKETLNGCHYIYSWFLGWFISAIPINAPFGAMVSVNDAFKNPCDLCTWLTLSPVLRRYDEFINHVASPLLSNRRVWVWPSLSKTIACSVLYM